MRRRQGFSHIADPLDAYLNRIRQSSISRAGPFDHLPAGTRLQCPKCFQLVEVRESRAEYKGRRLKFLSDCACNLDAIVKYEAFAKRSDVYQSETRSGHVNDANHIRHLTFDTFDSRRYPAENNPASEARAWIDAALPSPIADYHSGPVACLYFYSAGRGRGKTHLASAVAHVAAAYPRIVYFCNEMAWIDQYWSVDLETKRDMTHAAGERAWLTIIDDLGQRENPSASLRNAWYAVFDQRWLKRGWTIVTSNWRPDELLARGTINEATHSRLVHMTRGVIIHFHSGDYRLESASNHEA